MENSDSKNIGIDINVDASGMDAGFSSAQQKTEAFTTTLDKNKEAAEQVANKYDRVGLVLGGAVVAAAIAAGGAMVAMALNNVDLIDSIGKLTQRTGTSVENLAGLKFAADQSGASLETVARASKKLSTEMVQNPALFARMGVTAKDSTGALVQLADIFERMPAGVEKTAFASKLLGERLGAEMIPFLNQGSESLGNLIEQGKKYYPITADSAKQAEIFNDNLAELKLSTSAMGIELANTLLPNMVKTTTAMTELSREGHPVLALFRGLAGIAQIPWDILIPPEDLKKAVAPDGMIDDLTKKLKALEHERESIRGAGFGLINTDKIDREITIFQNQIETIKRHREELTIKPAEKPDVVTPADFAGNDKLLEQIRKFDEKMVESHKSAFDRMIDDWVELQNKMIAAGAYGSKERAAHEAAYTIFVDAENEKRNAAADKADEAKAKHLAAQLASEQAYFDKIDAAANENTMTAEGRERLRYETELINLQSRRTAAAADHQLSLQEETSFARAKEQITATSASRITAIDKAEADKRQRNNLAAAQAIISMSSQVANAAAGFLTATGQKNSEMAKVIFATQKALAIAQAVINTELAYLSAMALGPAGWAIAPAIKTMGYVSVGLIAATALIEGTGGGSAGGSVPQAQPGGDLTSPPQAGAPATGNPPQGSGQPESQPIIVNIYNSGNVLSNDFVENTIIPQIRDNISNSDVLIIDPRSRQAQALAAV